MMVNAGNYHMSLGKYWPHVKNIHPLFQNYSILLHCRQQCKY